MRKVNNKGFFLSETLIVATIVTAVVTLLYVTVIVLLNNYNKRSYYNNVGSLYAADNVRTLMYNKGIDDYFKVKLEENIKINNKYYYLVTCNDFADETYKGQEELCKYVYNYGTEDTPIGSVVVDKVIFTKYDISDLKGFSDDVITEGTTTDYINTIPVVEGTNDYRIIVILKERDGGNNPQYWYTTLKVIG